MIQRQLDGDSWTARRGPQTPAEHSLTSQDPDGEDHARVIHSYAFRRLQGKTQVLGIFGAESGDFYRTRLTHSLEVAELGSAMLGQLQRRAAVQGADWAAVLPSRTLLANICLAHDLGHPPFGHAGERTLDAAMRGLGVPDLGGFEANGQTLRLLSHLEIGPEQGDYGLNLTRRALLGVLKYPVAYSAAVHSGARPPKCYLDTEQKVVDWILAPLSESGRAAFTALGGRERSFDCRLMELADDAAYGVYDLEDGVNLHLLERGAWDALAAQMPELSQVSQLPSWADLVFSADEAERKRGVAALSRALVTGIDIRWQGRFDEPLLDLWAAFTPAATALQRFLTRLVWEQVIDTPQVRGPEAGACQQLLALFEAAQAEPLRWLGAESRRRLAGAEGAAERARVVCDYVAGMTDLFALRQAGRLG
ncbi:dNTP triphosphohydrolase [Deinococcus detaillensis]|uniref:DNTP triphosphohydrolase n=1 Tax=Deinococcus detaillensis TaxID=2592048 RepID=A0A553V0S9_9DEIO|nr:dNTP triphosphohydrolase [Deinococcus detaillensis]TSA86068.1 dNTP triphosphohydrolase [Deinococcus detaillensis]